MARDSSARRRKVLQAVVEAYVEKAEPVSSAAVCQRCRDLRLSSATLRSIMAELEEMGWLHQPHTSAGRVPTQRGLRAYVDEAMSRKLHPWDRSRLEEAIVSEDAAEVPQSLSHGLAGLTGQMAVIVVPELLGAHYREVGLVRCDRGKFLAYFVNAGMVQQKLVEMDFDLSPEELTRIQNFLNDRLVGRTLEEVRKLIRAELSSDEARADTLWHRAWRIGERTVPAGDYRLVVDGARNLLDQPEFADLERLRALMRTIDDKRALLRLLDGIMRDAGVKVVLSSEHDIGAVTDLSCVGAAVGGASGDQVAVSLVGPSRMDYRRLVPLVEYASELFGQYWRRL